MTGHGTGAWRRPVALILCLLGTATPSAAEGWRLRLTYDVYWRVLRVATLTTDTAVVSSSYRTALVLRTEGIVGTLFPWTLQAESDGIIDASGPHPTRHRGESIYRGASWHTRIVYVDGNPTHVDVEDPATARTGRPPVPGPDRVATVDPLTATLRVLHAMAHGLGCASTQRVFDGRLRYDVDYEELGPVVLEPSSRRSYAGPATRCRSRLHAIAGFGGADRGADDTIVTESLIAAAVPGASPVPVEIDLRGRRGTLHFYLRQTEPDP